MALPPSFNLRPAGRTRGDRASGGGSRHGEFPSGLYRDSLSPIPPLTYTGPRARHRAPGPTEPITHGSVRKSQDTPRRSVPRIIYTHLKPTRRRRAERSDLSNLERQAEHPLFRKRDAWVAAAFPTWASRILPGGAPLTPSPPDALQSRAQGNPCRPAPGRKRTTPQTLERPRPAPQPESSKTRTREWSTTATATVLQCLLDGGKMSNSCHGEEDARTVA